LNVITSPMLNGYVAYKYLGSQMLLALPPWCCDEDGTGTAISEDRRKLRFVYPWNYWQPS
jgi:hypothetical protein